MLGNRRGTGAATAWSGLCGQWQVARYRARSITRRWALTSISISSERRAPCGA